jgi:transposase
MAYQTDLKDSEWDLIKTYFEPNSKRGSSHKHEKKQIVNGILYLLKGNAIKLRKK